MEKSASVLARHEPDDHDDIRTSRASPDIMKAVWFLVLPTLAISLGFGAEQLRPSFAYVTNKFANTVSGYRIDPKTRALIPVPGTPFTTGSGPASVTVDATAEFAYVANFMDNSVSGYRINPKTGALTPVSGSPFQAGNGPASIAITRD